MKQSQKGFTLLEVLVATLIMAIAITGLLSNLTTSLRNASRLTDYDRAALLAKHKMDELQTETRLPKGIALEGAWDPVMTGGMPSGWRAVVTTYEMPPKPTPGTAVLDRIQLEIWWKRGEKRNSFVLEGFRQSLLRPEDLGAPQ